MTMRETKTDYLQTYQWHIYRQGSTVKSEIGKTRSFDIGWKANMIAMKRIRYDEIWNSANQDLISDSLLFRSYQKLKAKSLKVFFWSKE